MRFLITCSLLFVLFFSGCENKKQEMTQARQEQSTTLEQKNENQFILEDITGAKIVLNATENGFIFEDFKGKVVFLNFFATWCPPCKAEIPHLNTLQNKYKDQLKIISILLEEGKSNEDIITFNNANNVAFTTTNSPENFRLAKKVGGIDTIPYMIIYNQKGEKIKHYMGAIAQEMLEADLKRAF
ncbi:MAG: TlpA family protein disulfide reductase [Sulfurospirillum sp.]|nr:TlpA family protein disulfide reductase [Sulfurospirillum sp.]